LIFSLMVRKLVFLIDIDVFLFLGVYYIRP
jgi:hypothetical protein